ncbi:hypothetical protein Lal_00032372 [Lupinus albus]|nr:hypothetical protein Lal_00032372 [Lupinus albus]
MLVDRVAALERWLLVTSEESSLDSNASSGRGSIMILSSAMAYERTELLSSKMDFKRFIGKHEYHISEC